MFSLVCLVLFSVFVTFVFAGDICRTDNAFELNFPQGNSLIFQYYSSDSVVYQYVALESVVGDLNGTGGLYSFVSDSNPMYPSVGSLSFTASSDCDVVLTTDSVTGGVDVSGFGRVLSGQSISLVNGGSYVFSWSMYAEGLFNPDSFASGLDLLLNIVVVLVVLFGPAVGLMFVVKGGVWGFAAGLFIGDVLCYLLLPLIGFSFPLYVMFILMVVDVGVVLALSRRGG